jgi:hypothetical protein
MNIWTTRRPRLATLSLGLGLAVGACSSPAQSTSSGVSDSSSIVAALENPLLECQSEQTKCISSAADPQAAIACNEAFRTCLGAAAMAGEETASGVEDCRTQAVTCATSGGAAGATQCRTDYETCVGGLIGAGTPGSTPSSGTPSAPPSTPGSGGFPLPQLPGAGVGTTPTLPGGGSTPTLPGGGAGLPTLPGGGSTPTLPGGGAGLPMLPGGGAGLPTLPGGGAGLPTLPGGGSTPTLPGGGAAPGGQEPAGVKCLQDVRTCLTAAGADPNQCVTAGRECLRNAFGAPAAPGLPGTP